MNNNRERTNLANKVHSIPHVWVNKRCKRKLKCAVCHLSLGFLLHYRKCGSCKLSVHEDCKHRVNDNCGLTSKHFKEFLTQAVISEGQSNWAPEIGNSRSMNDIFIEEYVAVEETTTIVPEKGKLNRNMFNRRRNATWRDVTISFEEIDIFSLIGRGRFGEVYEAHHFGSVAIKLMDMNYVEEAKRLETFKQETACFQNARHENLIFFCGYAMDQGRLGIVMELIKGLPLSSLLHDEDSDNRLDFSDSVEYATQICQGMSYLHTKRILHKDLRSRNVFIKERERRVVITDFGLFNTKRLAYPQRRYSFIVPYNWLCYLAPELIKSLNGAFDPIPFTEPTDVYSFGTIWYELLMNCFPFSSFHPDSLIWQVGNGMKAPLASSISACCEARILLMCCWSFIPSDRKSFSEVLQFLSSIPKKTLRRSPSFPICKSFESIF